MCVAMFNKGIWPICFVITHHIMDEQSKTNHLVQILIKVGFSQMVNQL